MNPVQAFKALGPVDMKSIQRDALLRWMVLFPLFIGLLLRWGVPAIAGRLQAEFGFDLAPYFVLAMSLVVEMVPVMFGMIVGFLLLDQRDELTLAALQVTPLSLNGYLAYRVSLPTCLSLLGTLLVFPIANLVDINPLPLLLAALSAAPLAPLFALFLAAFAENKVQGFALTKASGVILLPPLLAYFIPSGWQLALGLAPTYWPVRCFWALQAGEGSAVFYLLAGLAYQGVLLAFLLRRFKRMVTV